jgi:hypothetical protein
MNAEEDAEAIASPVDENGDEAPQDHPIENPDENGGDDHDAIAEPHPDEPGAPDDAGDDGSGAEETSRPADD